MKAKITFKTGIYTGSILGVLLLFFGYYTFQKTIAKAEGVSNMDLHQLHYQNLEGDKVELSDYEGKYLLVNFWATWCGPCVKEFPILDEAYGKVKDDFVFVMVSYESIEKIKAFAQSKPYQFIFLKSNNFILEGITTVPQTFILDQNGKNIHHHPSIFEGDPKAIRSTLYDWIKIE